MTRAADLALYITEAAAAAFVALGMLQGWIP